jgi:hypothetical protein
MRVSRRMALDFIRDVLHVPFALGTVSNVEAKLRRYGGSVSLALVGCQLDW